MKVYSVSLNARKSGAIGVFQPRPFLVHVSDSATPEAIRSAAISQAVAEGFETAGGGAVIALDPTPRDRFAEATGYDLDRVNAICARAAECALLGAKECNGDPHRNNPNPADKSRNAELWGNARDAAAAELQRYVDAYGYKVEFNGLRPSLTKNGRTEFIPE